MKLLKRFRPLELASPPTFWQPNHCYGPTSYNHAMPHLPIGAVWFKQPVPVGKIPDYTNFVPKEKFMCIQKISKKIKRSVRRAVAGAVAFVVVMFMQLLYAR